MNDKERDRSSDGAGPAADDGGPSCSKSHLVLLYILFILIGSHPGMMSAQTGSGLSFSLDAGVLRANNATANFYNGAPQNANTINRILHSQAYGQEIWQNLKNQGFITDAIGSYSQLNVVEYGDMQYKIAFQLGMGFRYEYNGGWAWLMRFDYAKLNAVGAFNLSRDNNTGIISGNRYVTCDIAGEENRINIDLGIAKRFYLSSGQFVGLEMGGNLNNTKVISNDIRIAGETYSILDVWNGESPSAYSASYEYINQGGLGYGAFASICWGFSLPNGSAASVGYTLYYNKINLDNYSSLAAQHLFSLKFDITGFGFFDD